jgi:CTP:molybdopterin cytidylyltransferase MocA
MDKTAIVILAAGNSSRLGRPKQLLPFEGKTLVGHITDEALAAALDPVIVVTGAIAEATRAAIGAKPVEIVYNPHWEEGMASSIVAGLSGLLELRPAIQAIIFSVCDQPFLSATVFQELVHRKDQSKKGIIACFYRETVGTPVLFTYPYFQALLLLAGNEGARKLLLQYKDDLALVSFPKGHIDIDRPEDLDQLRDGSPQ